MQNVLRKATQVVIRVGPFVDAGDAVTPETAVSLSSADQAELLKQTGATVDIAAATFAAISGVDGWYNLTLTASHTDTVGSLLVVIQDASLCLPVWKEFTVVPENVYDALVSGTDWLPVTGLAPYFSIDGDQLTVRKQDGTTAQFTRTIASQAGAPPVTGLSAGT